MSESSERANERFHQALDSLNRGQWREAVELLHEHIRLYPKDSEALGTLAHLEYNSGHLQLAQRLYIRLALARPSDFSGYARLVIVWATALRRWAFRRQVGKHKASLLRRLLVTLGLLSGAVVERLLKLSRSSRYRSLFATESESIRLSFGDCARLLLRREKEALSDGIYYPRIVEVPLALNRVSLSVGQRVLDVGFCGSVSMEVLQAKGLSCVGVDMDTEAVRWHKDYYAKRFPEATRSGRILAMHADARALPFDSDSFDAVIAVSTLEHIPNDGDIQAMKEIGRVLAPAGRAFISLESGAVFREEWVETEIGYAYSSDRKERHFVRFYDEDAIRQRIIVPSGLEVVAQGYFGETTTWGALGLGSCPGWEPRLPSFFLNPVLALLFCKDLDPKTAAVARWKVPYVCLRKHKES